MRRKVVLGVIILVILVIAYNLLAQITNALKSSDRLSAQAEVVFNLEAKNRELKKRLSKIQSEEFIEEQARNKLGLGKNGETIVIIPDEKLKLVMEASQSAKEERLPNWLGWFKLFFK